MTTTTDELVETIEVAATPAQVWALVSDLPRMASWSPQVVRTIVKGRVRLGATAVNVNRRGPLFWPTRSRVVRFEPHRELAFRVVENHTIWSFTLEPVAGGTRVTQRRETPDGISSISRRLTKVALGGHDQFGRELRDGMRQTLARIKADAEVIGG
jgi:uncharacterized protein YndB with AHSA1/START domain